jgi:hypothetical protein
MGRRVLTGVERWKGLGVVREEMGWESNQGSWKKTNGL